MQVFNSTVNISTNIERADFVDASQNANRLQVSVNKDSDASRTNSEDSESPCQICFNQNGRRKIDLFRVIYAMHKLGFFVSPTGAPINQKDAFLAFGDMLGLDVSSYVKNISEAKKNNTGSTTSTKVFDEMKNAWLSFEDQQNY